MDAIATQFAGLNIDNPVESVRWLDNPNACPPVYSKETLTDWMTFGTYDTSVACELNFCEPHILSQLIKTLDQLKVYTEVQKKSAAKRTNKFESVGKIFFSSRSAMKFANLDALIKFTNPRDASGALLVTADDTINYADVTNSPDYGFIEYMQWRKGEFTKGYAFKNKYQSRCLWSRLDGRSKSVLETGSLMGDSTNTKCICSFVAFVRNRQPNGVHLVCSDNKNCDHNFKGICEVLLKRPTMCNCILALSTIGEHGTFIMKITESLTRFTVGLLYLVRQHFRQMCIVKPVTSRPANSERYVVFRSKLGGKEATDILVEHLLCLNDQWIVLHGRDVVELVPLDVIQKDVEFCEFMKDCNDQLASKQILNIGELVKQMENSSRSLDVQNAAKVREMCFRLWNLPEADERNNPLLRGEQLLTILQPHQGHEQLNLEKFRALFGNKTSSDFSNWCFTPIHQGNQNLTFFVSELNKPLIMWDHSKWFPLDDGGSVFNVPPGTVFYGELLTEEYMESDDKCHLAKRTSINVIDVFVYKYRDYRKMSNDFRRSLMTQWLNSSIGFVRYSKLKPLTQLTENVTHLRRYWKTIATERSKRLTMRYKQSNVSYPLIGLILFDTTTIDRVQPLFWDWQKDTYNVLNNDRAAGVTFNMFQQVFGNK